jgi:PQQ-like domain
MSTRPAVQMRSSTIQSMRLAASGALLILLGGTLVVPSASPPDWPGFRGPDMSGLALDASLPERWSATERVRWSVDVPGQGWSSPIVAHGVVYLTSAISKRPFKQPSPGIYGNDYIAELRAAGLSNAEVNERLRARDNELPEESDAIRYMVYAFDARTGTLKWERDPPRFAHRRSSPQEHVRLRNALHRW